MVISLLKSSELTTDLITFNYLSCHSSSTALGTKAIIEPTGLKAKEIKKEKVQMKPPKD